jgi:hypothetical protein
MSRLAEVSLSLLALAMALIGSGCGAEREDERAELNREIVNGSITDEFPATGMLILGPSPERGVIGCSVTLIGCDTILTAAHCVCEDTGPDCAVPQPLHVFFQNAGFFQVSSVSTHPLYNSAVEHDAAILRLAEPVTGILPVPVASRPVPAGSPAIIVGFGRTGGEAYEYGIKRKGDVVTTACSSELGSNKLCWRFDGSAGSGPSNVCHGDSGGSTYVVRDGVVEIVGVHSTTNQESCLSDPGTLESADTGVFEHLDYIRGGASLAAGACGDLPVVGEDGASVVSESGRIQLGGSANFEIEVPRGTAELRVALNSTDGAEANLDLYVRQGEPATASMYDCAAGGVSAHGFCEVASPTPGTWHVQVVAQADRSRWGGDFQMTATSLSGAPIGNDDEYAATVGKVLSISAEHGVLSNDEGTGRGQLTGTIEALPAHGQLSFEPDGGFHYLAEEGFRGTDSFTYRASDGSYQGPAVVTLLVAEADEGGLFGCAAAGGRSSISWASLLLVTALLLRRRSS